MNQTTMLSSVFINFDIKTLKITKWIKMIKSILIHEYQHKSTRVESTRINRSLPRISTSPTQVNTSQSRFDTIQHESTRIDKTRPQKMG